MQLHHVVVEKVLQYRNKRNKQREEFRETMGQMLFAFIFIMINLLGAFIVFAIQGKIMYEYRCTVVKIIDGDTVDVDIDLGFGVWMKKQRIRLYGIDTPESRTRDLEEKKYGLAAKDYLNSIANGDYVTLGVKGGGCSGFTYVWDYKKNWPDVKWGKPIDDVLVLDPVAEMFVLGCTVDYVKELGGSYLKVINPNAVASCGCGESFAVQE